VTGSQWYSGEDLMDRHGSFFAANGQWYYASNDRSHSTECVVATQALAQPALVQPVLSQQPYSRSPCPGVVFHPCVWTCMRVPVFLQPQACVLPRHCDWVRR
jgi:hypothetical protein